MPFTVSFTIPFSTLMDVIFGCGIEGGSADAVSASTPCFAATAFTSPAEPAVDAPRSAYVLAYSPDAATVAVIVRTQHADGSWDNDFLTRQNAAALRSASGDAPRIAYRRAVRYLRAKGLAPLSDAELRARGDRAARRLACS